MASYGLAVDQMMALSPRQKHEIYGEEEQPTAPKLDTAARLNQLLAMAKGGLVKATPAQIAELERRLSTHNSTS